MIIEKHARYGGFETRELIVEGDGPTVVLLHGFADSADTWLPVLERVAARGRAARAYDLPGFGTADPLATGPALEQLDGFVSAVLSDNDLAGPSVVVGNSMGAILALRAGCVPELPIRRIVAMGVPTEFRAVVDMILVGRMFTPVVARLPMPEPMLARTARIVIRRGLYGTPSAHDAEVVERFRAQVPDMRAVHRLLQKGRAYAAQAIGALQADRVRVPVTVVHGTSDRLIRIRGSRRLHEALPDSTLVVLPGVGHCPQLDAPDEVVRVVLPD